MVFFIFIQSSIENSEREPDQTLLFVASDLGLHGLPMFYKKDTRFIWVN